MSSRPFEVEMSKIFDITKSEREWLCEEKKKLYANQVKSNGSIGYVTNKKVFLNPIHPLKKSFKETF